MIEYAARTRKLPAPPRVVWDSLMDPHRPKSRPWLVFLGGEIEPRVLDAEESQRVAWSSLWPSRPADEIHIELSAVDGQTSVSFRLLTPVEAPDEDTGRGLRRRISHLLFADLRLSYDG